MDLALTIARSGMEAHHKNLEIISNNLANANTTGFKKNRPEFEELPYQIVKQPSSPTSDDTNSTTGLIFGTGTKLSTNKKIQTEGNPIITDSQMDIMIHGRGYLQVALPNGDFAYTRAGNLEKNDVNQLVTPNGYIIQPPITLPQDTEVINIAQDGTVSAAPPNTTAMSAVGQIQLTDFINPDGLTPIGENLYIPNDPNDQGTVGNAGVNGLGVFKQGQLEGSNVSVIEEMVSLIEAQRGFEVMSKAVSAVDNMMQYLSRET